MTPAEQIRAAREAADMTAKELADKLGTTAVSVMRWERGEVPLSLKRLEQIADVLGLRVEVRLVEVS